LASYNATAMSDGLVVLHNAVVCPPDDSGRCGVLDAEGAFVTFSQDHYRPRKARLPPDPSVLSGPLADLPGRHLFAGPMHPHFGHFLLESTPRLWALDQETVASALFIPYGPGSYWRARKAYLPLLEILCGDLPIERISAPTRVAELVVPDPGFGHEGRMRGSDRYRAFTRGRVAVEITAAGPEKLYISRSGLNDNRGGIFGEAEIEAVLAEAGYEIFHPQRHSYREQLARYAAARQIIGLDGSALHMAAYALQPEAQVAIIARRRSPILARLADQLVRFSGASVEVLDCLTACWVKEGGTRIDYASIGEVDMPALFQRLIALGFIPAGLPSLAEAAGGRPVLDLRGGPPPNMTRLAMGPA
jgi:capsular polysaccharide biosynthesis protein